MDIQDQQALEREKFRQDYEQYLQYEQKPPDMEQWLFEELIEFGRQFDVEMRKQGAGDEYQPSS